MARVLRFQFFECNQLFLKDNSDLIFLFVRRTNDVSWYSSLFLSGKADDFD